MDRITDFKRLERNQSINNDRIAGEFEKLEQELKNATYDVLTMNKRTETNLGIMDKE